MSPLLDALATGEQSARSWTARARNAVIVLGDLKDGPPTATIRVLPRPPGSELETAGFNQPDKGDGMGL